MKLKCDNGVNVNVLVLQYGAALIVDEVQTGGGSTGHYWWVVVSAESKYCWRKEEERTLCVCVRACVCVCVHVCVCVWVCADCYTLSIFFKQFSVDFLYAHSKLLQFKFKYILLNQSGLQGSAFAISVCQY